MNRDSTSLLVTITSVGLILLAIPLVLMWEADQRFARQTQQVWVDLGREEPVPTFDPHSNAIPASNETARPAGATVPTTTESKQSSSNAASSESVPVVAVSGGDAVAGRKIFFENEQASCSKCHRVGSVGGQIGPAMTEIGKKSREEIVESILEPNKKITEGFSSLIVATLDGQIVAGVLRENSEERIVLVDADGKETIIPQDDVDETQPGLSAMPATYRDSLTPKDLEDLVAYLMSLK